MFHVKRPFGTAETGLFRVECGDHQLPFHFPNFTDQGIRVGPIKLSGWVIQQQDRGSASVAPDQFGHRKGERCTQQFLLPAGQDLASELPLDPEMHIEAVRPGTRCPPFPVSRTVHGQ